MSVSDTIPVSAQPGPQPVGDFIRLDAAGQPALWGFRCSSCSEVFLEGRRACPRCATPGALVATPLQPRGTLFTYTIVHRSFPGIRVPFISAVVRLEAGAYLRGNLVGIPADAKAIRFDMPVRVEFERLAPLSADGPPILRHVFVPEGQEHAT